jgi:hypothetical protein
MGTRGSLDPGLAQQIGPGPGLAQQDFLLLGFKIDKIEAFLSDSAIARVNKPLAF